MAVERSRWTDDRLDELAFRVMRQEGLEARMDRFERDLADFRAEMREFKAEMRDFRTELTGQVNDLRSELYATKRWMLTMWLSGLLAFATLFLEISLRT